MCEKLKLQILKEEQCEKIYQSAIKILNDTGADVKDAHCRELLAAAGCKVDGIRVYFPEELIQKSFESAPDRIKIYNKYGEIAAVLDAKGENNYFAPGVCAIYRYDLETGERRPTVLKDIYEAGLVEETLENFTFANGLAYANDCPQELATAFEAQQLLLTCSKPFTSGGVSLMEQKVIFDLCAAVAGGMDALREKPMVIAPASLGAPLDHHEENLKAMMYSFEVGVPVFYIVSVMMAATAPATIAGSAALALADNIVALVLSQLVRKGNPYIGGGFIDLMDMRNLTAVHTSPEFALANLALSDVFHYLGIPSVAHLGSTDSAIFDQQAAMDITAQLYSGLLSGVNFSMFSGFLESAVGSSLEALVFADDTLGYLKKIIAGVEISDETLGLETIDEVGPAGSYIGTDHTLDYYPEHWQPTLFARQNYEAFVKSGSLDYQAKANQRIKEIIAKGIQKPLDDEIVKKMEVIMEKAVEQLKKES